MADVETGRDDIQIETNEISAVVREIAIEVAGKRVDAAFGRVVNELRKTARVKGFRPGKVPANVTRDQLFSSLSAWRQVSPAANAHWDATTSGRNAAIAIFFISLPPDCFYCTAGLYDC